MTKHKAVHPRDNVDKLYVSIRGERRRLVCIKDSVDASIQRLEDYIEKGWGKLIAVTRNNINDTRSAERK